MESITKEQALEIALRHIAARLRDPERIIVQDEKTLEREFGWVFFVTTKEYARTQDPKHLAPGIGPLVVEREGGDAAFLPTSVPPDRAIAEYERRWRARRNDPAQA